MQYPGSAHVLEHVEGPRHSSLGQESLVFKGFKAGVAAPTTLQPHTALMTCFPECLIPGPSCLPDLAAWPRLRHLLSEPHSKDEGDGLQTSVSSDLLQHFLSLACLPSSYSHIKALAKMPFPQEAFSAPSLDSPSSGSFPLVLWVWKYLCLVLSLPDWRLLREHRPT